MMQINLSAWATMQSLLDWQHASANGDFATLSRLMAQVIMAWQHDANPADEASYAQLAPDAWADCVKEVSVAIGAMFRG